MSLRKFDTKVQHLKYKVMREVARLAWDDRLMGEVLSVAKKIIPGKEATIRCCVYKERAVVEERVKLAMGLDLDETQAGEIIQIIDIACDDCPVGGYEVTGACRGCMAKRCEDVCPRGAIVFDSKHVASIDKDKCVECGKCEKACPFSAIINFKRPCQRACQVDAISMNEHHSAMLDHDKCVDCGACVYQCPWGAITDKSGILDVIKLLQTQKVYAVVAPSISSQFTYATLPQVVAGIKALGFHDVAEAALGADMVALSESKELVEKGFLASSCCPSFVRYVDNTYPELAKHVSHMISPAAEISRHIKSVDKEAKIVFIGPCISKKKEYADGTKFVDAVITFEELQALFDSRDFDIAEMEGDALQTSSYYGRIFARSGGVSAAISQAIVENELDFELKAVPCSGLDECKAALHRLRYGRLDGNFIEGMACSGGCVGGAGCLTHGEKCKTEVDRYGKDAQIKTMSNAVKNPL
jgi:Iron only hydrogenase large subunit, C-terminal domain